MILAGLAPLYLSLGVGAALAYLASAAADRFWRAATARALLTLAWLLHGLQLIALFSGHPISFGFAQTLSITVWLVLTVYGIERRLYPRLPMHWPLALLGGVGALLSLVFAGTPLPATSSPWLALHWALSLSAYGLLAAAVVHGWLMGHAERQMRVTSHPSDAGIPILTLERLMFRFVGAGFALLTLTLLAGLFFGEQQYGHLFAGWRWDHNHVFSILSWLVFAALLLGHWRFGWRGRRAVRMVNVGALLLLLGYVGSRFVLEVVLGRTP